MPDPVNPPTSAETTPHVQNPTPAAAPQAPSVETVSMSSEALSKRLTDERERAQRQLLKELGVEKLSDLRTAVESGRKAEDANRTEMERLNLQVAESAKVKDEAARLRATVASLVDSELGRLPEKVRETIKSQSDDPQAQLALVNVMRSAGLLDGAPVVAQPPAPAATEHTAPAVPAAPAAPANNGAVSPAPQPQQARTPYEIFIAKQSTDKFGADLFYQANKTAIEASRPAGS